jgi:hypothetical protein
LNGTNSAPLLAMDEHEASHHRQVVGAHPNHAAIAGAGRDRVASEVRLLGVAQLAEVNDPRFVGIELQAM